MANVIEIKVRATAEGLRGEIRSKAKAAAVGQKIEIPIVADSRGWADAVQQAIRSNPSGESVKIPVRADETGLRSEVTRATKAAETGQSINVPVKVDSRGTSELGRFAQTAAQLAPFILPAVAAVSTLSGALAVMPAMAAGAGFGLATLAVGMSGVTDVFTAHEQVQKSALLGVEAQATATARYNQALAELAPNARTTALAVIGLGGAWRDLRLDVQQRLFAELDDTVVRIGRTSLPVLHTGMANIADSINAATLRVGEFVTSEDALRDWAAVLDNSALAGDRLAESVTPILSIITDIVAVGSEFLPGLADNFGDAADSAAEFISNARETGQLHDWIQGGLDAVGQLWEMFTNVVAVMTTITQTVGPGLLGFFNLLIGAVAWVLDNFPAAVPIIGGIVAAVWAWNAAQLVLNSTMLANPIGIVIVAIGALVGWFVYMWNTSEDFRNFWIGLWRGIVDWTKWGVNQTITLLNGLIMAINGVISGINFVTGFNIGAIPHIPHFAAGGIGGGLALVGEHGPELVRLPQGSSVMNAGATRSALEQDSGEQRVVVELNLSGLPGDMLDLIRDRVRVHGGDVQAALGP